ncbi:hypothetical protein [Phaeobacter sp. SYSU ZJ3003]|uniref:hypothetical protein n=1 Tax=Phaeobacter sp. SYSU ZJ3003 TaxID=2109330 RepID=UPI00351BF6E4
MIASSNERNIFVRHFDSSNQALSDDILISDLSQISGENWTDTHGSSIARLKSGDFIAVWANLSGVDGDAAGVFARFLDPSGDAKGSVFQVNTTYEGNQWSPAVSALSDGGFVVAWQTPDGSGRSVILQTFDAFGIKRKV